MDRVPVRRAPHADSGRNQQSSAGHAGICAASLRPCVFERRRLTCSRLHEGHAPSALRRNSDRQDTGIQRVFSSHDPTPSFCMRHSPRGRNLSRRSDDLDSLVHARVNRFGITSAIDAGGGFQNYPDDYEMVNELHKRGERRVNAPPPVPEPPRRSSPISGVDEDDEAWRGRRFLSGEWRGRNLGRLRCGLWRTFCSPAPDMAPVMESELDVDPSTLGGEPLGPSPAYYL